MDTRKDSLVIFSKKVIHKAAKATGEFIGKKIINKIEKLKPVEKKPYSTRNERRNIKQIKTSIIKM